MYHDKKRPDKTISGLCILDKITHKLFNYDINLIDIANININQIIENLYNYKFLLIDNSMIDSNVNVINVLQTKYPKFPIIYYNDKLSYCQPLIHNPINRKYNNSCIISQSELNDNINDIIRYLDCNKISFNIYDKDYILSNDDKHICDGQLTYKQIIQSYKLNKYAINIKNENVINACGCISNNNITTNKSAYDLHIDAMKNYTYKHLINSLLNRIIKPLTTSVNKDDILILYLMNDIKSNVNNEFINGYNHIKINILDRKNIKLNKCKYLFIMYDKLYYSSTYIEHTLLAYKFTDCKIVGKACYYLNDQIINQQYENTFTNRLHTFTLCINMSSNNHIYIPTGNIYDYTISYLRKLPNGACYSYYKYEFKDTDCVNHLYSLYSDIIVPKCMTYVIMCNWKRTDNFKQVLNKFKLQTRQDFHICIWNNNINDYNKLFNIVKLSQLTNVTIFNSAINIGGFGRFICANKINNDNAKVIFLDDDQDFDKHVINKFVTKISEMDKNISLHWYGRKFIKNKPYCYVDKNNAIINSHNCIQEIKYGQEYDYGGTGGMCINIGPFKNTLMFTNFPILYLYCEDMWSSYILKNEFSYKLIKFDVNILIKKDSNDQCSGLWRTKADFLDYLRHNNYNV